jgi:O-antigen/teichoic acid export membrane protein
VGIADLLRGASDGETNRGRAARLMGATALGQLLAFAAAPFLTRWLGPQAFGEFGVYVAVLGALSGAVSWRLGLAVPVPGDDREATAIVGAGLFATVVSCAIVALGIALVGTQLTRDWFELETAAPLLWFVPIALLGIGVGDVLGGWGLRHRQYQALVAQRVTRSTWTTGWQLVHAFFRRASAHALVIGDAVGRIWSIVPIARIAWRTERERGPLPDWSAIRAALRAHRAFVLAATPANLLNKLGEWIPVLLLTAWWGPVASGLFVVGQRLVGVPIGLIGDSAGQVYIAELAAAQRGDRSAFRPLFARYARTLAMLAVVTAIVLFAIGPSGFALALGAEWADAGRMVRWQSVALAIQLVAIPMAHTLVVLAFQNRQLLWDAARLAATVGAFLLARQRGFDAVDTVALHGAVSAVLYVGLVWLSWRAVGERALAKRN